LLIEIVESFRFEAGIEELVEIVRCLDILGAEKRLSEYEAILYMKLAMSGQSEKEWQGICGERLPVAFFVHIKKFENRYSILEEFGILGSQRLIEYFLEKNFQWNRNNMFIRLCENGHLSVAQWFYGLGGVDIHAENDHAFRGACYNGHLLVAQWLYYLGDANIPFQNNAFTSGCRNGHLSVVQWLYSLGTISIHDRQEEVFRLSCSYGHLSIAQWLYSLGDVNIHIRNDEAFREACVSNHLHVAQWLYELGGIDIQIEYEHLFRTACRNGHFSTAQWLYSLGGISNEILLQINQSSRNKDDVSSWLQSLITVAV
jgi:hypothetical protein